MKIICNAALVFLLMVGIIGCYPLFVFGPFLFDKDLRGTLPPLPLKKAVYLSIIRAIQLGQLNSKSSIIALPPTYRGVTPKDLVYHERRKDGRLWVLFPTWYGRGGDLQGYLYTSGPLLAKDFHNIEWGQGANMKYLYACGYELPLVEKIDGNWYRVWRRES